MADYTPSASMSLPVPVVGVAPGPEYASLINSCLTIIDAHTHASGDGVQITPAGLNINDDLEFNANDLTGARSLRLYANAAVLGAVTDVGCLYRAGVDLYFNDGNSNQIRLTQSGSISGTTGSITGLVAPATATYVPASSKFVWQSAVNTSAIMDAGSVIIRNASAASYGLTLQAPLAMGADSTIVLPALPASQKFLTLDASGNMVATWAADASTIEVVANSVRVKDLGITAAKLAADSVTTVKILDANVTLAKLAAAAKGLSNFTVFTTSGTWTCPAGVNQIILFIRAGGGGGGGGRSGGTAAGGGGGGGAVLLTVPAAVTPGTVYTITVGAGGVGGAVNSAGAQGGTSSMVGVFSTFGGFGGSGSPGADIGGAGGQPRPGAGGGGGGSAGTTPGSGSGGGVTPGVWTQILGLFGGTTVGGAGGASNIAAGGAGGSSTGGGGGGGGDGTGGAGGNGSSVGAAGTSGAGGGGGGTNAAGGAGGDGVIAIYWVGAAS